MAVREVVLLAYNLNVCKVVILIEANNMQVINACKGDVLLTIFSRISKT